MGDVKRALDAKLRYALVSPLAILTATVLLVALLIGLHLLAAQVLGPAGVDKWLLGDKSVVAEWLVIFSGLANVSVALVALYVVPFARRQAEEAARSRLASLYLEIKARWESEQVTISRRKIRTITQFYDRNSAKLAVQFPVQGEYVALVLMTMRRDEYLSYVEYTHVLDVLEELGMLCRRELLDYELLVELVGAQISFLCDALTPFCLEVRRQTMVDNLYSHPNALYANALWLFDRCSKYTPFYYREIDPVLAG